MANRHFTLRMQSCSHTDKNSVLPQADPRSVCLLTTKLANCANHCCTTSTASSRHTLVVDTNIALGTTASTTERSTLVTAD